LSGKAEHWQYSDWINLTARHFAGKMLMDANDGTELKKTIEWQQALISLTLQ